MGDRGGRKKDTESSGVRSEDTPGPRYGDPGWEEGVSAWLGNALLTMRSGDRRDVRALPSPNLA